MKPTKGTTLMELMVVVVLAGIMLLAAGAVTDIGKQSSQRLTSEASIYNGITYGFKLIRNRVHETTSLPVAFTASAPWIIGTERLEVGNEAFGIYDEAGSTKSFVYVPDKTNLSSRRTIFEVSGSDTLIMTIDPAPLDPDPLGDKVEITLSGTKNGAPFSMKMTVQKRI